MPNRSELGIIPPLGNIDHEGSPLPPGQKQPHVPHILFPIGKLDNWGNKGGNKPIRTEAEIAEQVATLPGRVNKLKDNADEIRQLKNKSDSWWMQLLGEQARLLTENERIEKYLERNLGS